MEYHRVPVVPVKIPTTNWTDPVRTCDAGSVKRRTPFPSTTWGRGVDDDWNAVFARIPGSKRKIDS
jgi:hypothetical protein